MAAAPDSRAVRAAELLLAVRRGAPRLAALPAALVPQTLAEAYAIQHQLLGALGSRIGGWKATLFDVHHGICAPLPVEALLRSPAQTSSNPIATANTQHFGIEPEIAFLIGTELPPRAPARRYRTEEVCAAVASAHAVIEVVVTRYRDADAVSQLERVADNFMHEALVIGPACESWRSLALGALPLEVEVDGVSVHSAVGGHPLGDPLLPLVWLANHLVDLGLSLKCGEYVTTGSCNGVRYALPGQQVQAEFAGLGAATVRF